MRGKCGEQRGEGEEVIEIADDVEWRYIKSIIIIGDMLTAELGARASPNEINIEAWSRERKCGDKRQLHLP